MLQEAMQECKDQTTTTLHQCSDWNQRKQPFTDFQFWRRKKENNVYWVLALPPLRVSDFSFCLRLRPWIYWTLMIQSLKSVLNLHYNSSVREVNSVICPFHPWNSFKQLFNVPVYNEQWTMQSESICWFEEHSCLLCTAATPDNWVSARVYNLT